MRLTRVKTNLKLGSRSGDLAPKRVLLGAQNASFFATPCNDRISHFFQVCSVGDRMLMRHAPVGSPHVGRWDGVFPVLPTAPFQVQSGKQTAH